MRFAHAFGNGQTQSSPSGRSPGRHRATLERFEDTLQVDGRNTSACIGNLQHEHVFRNVGTQMKRFAVRSERTGIGQDVAQCLRNPFGIAVQRVTGFFADVHDQSLSATVHDWLDSVHGHDQDVVLHAHSPLDRQHAGTVQT